jgi:uncharacterized membrane protein YkvA (DUF1232 family)
MYLSVPIDPFDILFPWMAFSDDLFIAGILLKILHKHGGLPEEVRTSPIELLRDIFKRSNDKTKIEPKSWSTKLFVDHVCKDCTAKQ